MAITIGEQTLATHRPADLDAQLVEQTGCSAAEHAAMLAQSGTAYQTARVLLPMLADDDAPALDALTAAIEATDEPACIRRAVAELLVEPVSVEPAEESNHG